MRKVKLFLIFLLVTFFAIGIIWTFLSIQNVFTPKTTITISDGVLKELRSLNRLETASFTVEKIIDAGTSGNAFSEFLYGDRILLIANGQIIAGFDLSNLKEEEVVINGKEIKLILPKPQILVTTLDNNKTRVYDRKRGILSQGDKDLEAKARLAAEQSIYEAACKGNILEEASNNARKQLGALLKALGFETVTIEIPQASC